MEETIWTKIVHAVVFLTICAGIIYLSWEVPLRNRFISAETIAAESSTPAPVQAAETPPPRWQPGPSALDRGAYRTRKNEPNSTRIGDRRPAASPTRSDGRR